jgi:hypothetical protein
MLAIDDMKAVCRPVLPGKRGPFLNRTTTATLTNSQECMHDDSAGGNCRHGSMVIPFSAREASGNSTLATIGIDSREKMPVFYGAVSSYLRTIRLARY